MLQSLILIDALSSAFLGEKNKTNKQTATTKNNLRLFFQGQTQLPGCAVQDFHSWLVQLKADLKVRL
jgi:hypothetical protein